MSDRLVKDALALFQIICLPRSRLPASRSWP